MSSKRSRFVILGISGSIAAYKAADVARRLLEAGFEIQPVMTSSAREFVGPLTFEAITGRKVPRSELWMTPRSKIGHIELLKNAAAVVVAPATANLMAKAANGIADDLLSTLVSAATCPVIIAPAMNSSMYLSKACQENINRLERRGVFIVEPTMGVLACGDEGIGKLADSKQIVRKVTEAVAPSKELEGVKAVVTVGGTLEHIDPVRVITNLSSGRTGMAIARELLRLGAEVSIIAARTDVPAPKGAKVLSATTGREMLKKCKSESAKCDVLVMAAAISDLTPVSQARAKIKRAELAEEHVIVLKQNPDILFELGALKKRPLLVGFAAETSDYIGSAKRKIINKNCDLMVANLVGDPKSDFGLSTTTAAIVRRSGKVRDLGNITKDELAAVLCVEIREEIKKKPQRR